MGRNEAREDATLRLRASDFGAYMGRTSTFLAPSLCMSRAMAFATSQSLKVRPIGFPF